MNPRTRRLRAARRRERRMRAWFECWRLKFQALQQAEASATITIRPLGYVRPFQIALQYAEPSR